jgi:hypothetical protein
VSFIGEDKAVLDTAAAFEDVRVFGVIVSLADYVCGAELELFGERGGAGPLDVVLVVVCASVLAAHYVDFIEAAGTAADAFELYDVLAVRPKSMVLVAGACLWYRLDAPV